MLQTRTTGTASAASNKRSQVGIRKKLLPYDKLVYTGRDQLEGNESAMEVIFSESTQCTEECRDWGGVQYGPLGIEGISKKSIERSIRCLVSPRRHRCRMVPGNSA